MVNMETLRAQVEEKKAKLFRRRAMRAYGDSKGAISKALNKAIEDWLSRTEAKKGLIRASELTGMASDLKDSSLSAQKKAEKLMARD